MKIVILFISDVREIFYFRVLNSLLFISLNMFSINNLSAQDSGTGCNVGGKIAVGGYLGDAPYYGNTSDMRPVYKSTFVSINTNGYGGYICGSVNVYPAGSRWDPQIPPYGDNAPYDEQKEMMPAGSAVNCIAASSRFATPEGEGSTVTFSYNNPTFCNVPLDDYIPILIACVGFLGVLYISKTRVVIVW